jgi:hypothetical protein
MGPAGVVFACLIITGAHALTSPGSIDRTTGLSANTYLSAIFDVRDRKIESAAKSFANNQILTPGSTFTTYWES